MSAKEKRKKSAYPGLLPGYDLYAVLDMSKDREILERISFCNIIICVVMIGLGASIVPIKAAFSMELLRAAGCVAAMLIGMVVYIFLHEWVHGFFIRLITGESAEYGFIKKTGMAYAKSSWFFEKKAYIVIALSPVVIWGIVISMLLKDIPDEFFWYLYMIQIMNISGAVGDFYVTWLVTRMPKDILIFDEGVSMKFFAPVKFDNC